MADLNVVQLRAAFARGQSVAVYRPDSRADYKEYLLLTPGEEPDWKQWAGGLPHVGFYALLHFLKTGEVRNTGPQGRFDAVYVWGQKEEDGGYES